MHATIHTVIKWTVLPFNFKTLDEKCVILQSPENLHPGGDGQALWVSSMAVSLPLRRQNIWVGCKIIIIVDKAETANISYTLHIFNI